MMDKIKSFLKIGRTSTVDDTGAIRFVNVSYQGRPSVRCMSFTPWGFDHNPPAESMAVAFQQNGQESNNIAMVSDPNGRTKLNDGEVIVYNPDTGASVLFDENGNIEITVQDANSVAFTIGGMRAIIDSNGINITGGDVVADGVSLKTHTHGGVEAGGSNTGSPN